MKNITLLPGFVFFRKTVGLVAAGVILVAAVAVFSQDRIRKPAVAGQFYPDNPADLRKDVESFASGGKTLSSAPKMLICPHAGYEFSGPVAGKGFAAIDRSVSTVIILGPPHHVWVHGIAAPGAEWFETPLGKVAVDTARVNRLLRSKAAYEDPAAHAPEHSLEVELPFLQVRLGAFEIVPLLVNDIDPQVAANAIFPLIDRHTLVIASSDLSHFFTHEEARKIDDRTIANILAGRDADSIVACGAMPIRVVMRLAAMMLLTPVLLDARTSFDTAPQYGPGRVVGYASIAYVKKRP
jgi:AmmeMemoRadiSam system protein B